jgi:hypothetical protein
MANDARSGTEKMRGQVFAKLDPQTAEKWRSAAEPVLDEWAGAYPKGKEVLAKFRELLAEAKSGK